MENIIHIPINTITLEGALAVPKNAKGIVLFAHGSGSSRLSPRNRYVASVLQKAQIATLLIDLLTELEDQIYATRFDTGLLTDRLLKITKWLQKNKDTKHLSIGLFGASTGAAAALQTAAKIGSDITAVVSRGGRPDLAMDVLGHVTSPTLLIVGGDDFGVIELNEQAYKKLPCEKELVIIPGATHLFEEEGALENVAQQASKWFQKHFENQKGKEYAI